MKTNSKIAKQAADVYENIMHKTIRDYLPPRPAPKTTLVQARVDTQLVLQVKRIMKQEGLSWAKLLEACLKSFVDDRAQK